MASCGFVSKSLLPQTRGQGYFGYFYSHRRTLLLLPTDVSEALGEIFCVDQTPDGHPLSLFLAGVPHRPENSVQCRHFAAPPSPVVH
jgi:hypothetical protein